MRIVVATDGSPDAKRAVQTASQFVRNLRTAEVILVNVGPIPALALTPPEAAMHVDVEPIAEALERGGHRILDQAAATFAEDHVSVTCVYRRGDPSREILRVAEEAHADLIVVGARGLGRIGGLILGSVSERVVHAASMPVMVVRDRRVARSVAGSGLEGKEPHRPTRQVPQYRFAGERISGRRHGNLVMRWPGAQRSVTET